MIGLPVNWAAFARILRFAAALAICAGFAAAQPSSDRVNPGAPWLDNRGQLIQAHGGGIIHIGKTYFWFGEDRFSADGTSSQDFAPINAPARALSLPACFLSPASMEFKPRSS